MNSFKVPIKNILYMYSYVWDKVNSNDFVELDAIDDFESSNIYAELFLLNIHKIIRKGLIKEYIEKEEELKGLKGKINFKESIKNLSFYNAKAVCDFDKLEVDNIYNQILKTTAIKLYKSSDLHEKYKKRLNEIILYFSQIEIINLDKTIFDKIKFSKNNQHYYYIIKICELINSSLMLSEFSGKYKFINIFDNEKNMHYIFELFINRFYKQELSKEYKVYFQKQLYWNFADGNKQLLPIMKLDTTIESDNETIILDTKYYKSYYSVNEYGTKKFKSEHLYQMFAYLNNYNSKTKLRGIILYPMPFSYEEVKESYEMKVLSHKEVDSAKIEIITINLSDTWIDIKNNLLNIVKEKEFTNI